MFNKFTLWKYALEKWVTYQSSCNDGKRIIKALRKVKPDLLFYFEHHFVRREYAIRSLSYFLPTGALPEALPLTPLHWVLRTPLSTRLSCASAQCPQRTLNSSFRLYRKSVFDWPSSTPYLITCPTEWGATGAQPAPEHCLHQTGPTTWTPDGDTY